MTSRRRGLIGIAYLALCLLLGGASAAGAVANAVLQSLAIFIIVILVWSRSFVVPAEARPLGWIVLVFIAWGVITLVPFPGDFWQSLPYRDQVAQSLRLLGLSDQSMPLSLTPAASVASLLWLLPPAAMFLLAVGLAGEERRRLAVTIIVLSMLSVVLGVIQLLGGGDSSLRLYTVTNAGSPVGFFANINHQATLILCALPLIAMLATRFSTGVDKSKRSGGLVIAAALSLFLSAGIALCGSIAGYGLLVPTALASVLIYRSGTSGALRSGWKAVLAAAVCFFIGIALLGPVSQQSISGKLSTSPDSRREIAVTTLEAIKDNFPLGSGLGSFSSLYRLYEDPQQATREYTNRAHNDYLELWLETGIVGLLLVFSFVLWWLRQSAKAWRSDLTGMQIARSASVIVGIVLMHSLVDYPLRTSSIAALFATACAFLLPPPAQRRRSRPRSTETLNHLEAHA